MRWQRRIEYGPRTQSSALFSTWVEASFKSQFKRADKSGAEWALIYGHDEVAANKVTVKPLRSDGEQQLLTEPELTEFLIRLSQANDDSEE